MTIIWCMVPEIWNTTEYFLILDYFLPFYPPNNPENQNFEKMKKMPGDIILHMCTMHENHMMYGSWDMEHNRQNFVSFDHFWPFYHLKQTRKPRSEKTKKCMEMQSISKIVIICYTVPGIWPCDECICYLTKCPDKNSHLLTKKKIEKHSLTQNFDTLHCFLASSVFVQSLLFK